jgi:hypothetical protein
MKDLKGMARAAMSAKLLDKTLKMGLFNGIAFLKPLLYNWNDGDPLDFQPLFKTMIPLSIASQSPVTKLSPDDAKIQISPKLSPLKPVQSSFHKKNPNTTNKRAKPKTRPFGSILITPDHVSPKKGKISRG